MLPLQTEYQLSLCEYRTQSEDYPLLFRKSSGFCPSICFHLLIAELFAVFQYMYHIIYDVVFIRHPSSFSSSARRISTPVRSSGAYAIRGQLMNLFALADKVSVSHFDSGKKRSPRRFISDGGCAVSILKRSSLYSFQRGSHLYQSVSAVLPSGVLPPVSSRRETFSSFRAKVVLSCVSFKGAPSHTGLM